MNLNLFQIRNIFNLHFGRAVFLKKIGRGGVGRHWGYLGGLGPDCGLIFWIFNSVSSCWG